jgi:hypothetical protein
VRVTKAAKVKVQLFHPFFYFNNNREIQLRFDLGHLGQRQETWTFTLVNFDFTLVTPWACRLASP